MITIICIGKERVGYIDPLIQDFHNRLKAWVKIEWKILPPSGFNGEAARKAESSAILSKLANVSGRVWLLDETGEELSTMQLARRMDAIKANSVNIIFVIGGAYGVNDALKKRADFIWSLSRLTLPHQMARLILVEQLYRAYGVSYGSKYHHA